MAVKFIKYASVIIFLLLFQSVLTQESVRLQQLRRELKRLESELKSKEDREKSLLEQVETSDRQVGMQQKLIRALQVERGLKEERIQEAEKQLAIVVKGYDRRKELVAERMVWLYKRGRMADWEVIFSMKSLNQLMVWIKYQKKIMENDRRNLRKLQDQKMQIEKTRETLAREMREKERLIAENRATVQSLETKKKTQRRLLSTVRKDRASLMEGIRQRRLTYNQIRDRIGEVESRREARPFTGTSRFKDLKGRLGWPVKGKVVSKHGLQRDNEIRNIEHQNLGIEIQGSDGAPVWAVCDGNVIDVKWFRAMGNLIILDHGGGYYTVYGHLNEVYVNTGDMLAQGEMLGRLGDKSGLYGSNLHFQIWKGQNDYDPETWLSRNK
jgi:septal ring factor EnvC (AmiA/AmiB activator)